MGKSKALFTLYIHVTHHAISYCLISILKLVTQIEPGQGVVADGLRPDGGDAAVVQPVLQPAARAHPAVARAPQVQQEERTHVQRLHLRRRQERQTMNNCSYLSFHNIHTVYTLLYHVYDGNIPYSNSTVPFMDHL